MGTRDTYTPETLRRLQLVELDMLRSIDEVCRELGISYWLDSGTCLGAVRHKGFIPWDDDIDVGMSYEEYLRFQQEAPQLLKERGLSLHTCNNTPNLPILWAKVFLDGTRFMSTRDIEAHLTQGIFIDIFPYFNVDEQFLKSEWRHNALALCQNLSYLNVFAHPQTYQYTSKANIASWLCLAAHYTFARGFTPPRMLRLAKHLTKVKHTGNDWRPIFAFTSLKRNMPGEVLFPVKPIMFEGESFSGPADPEAYLRILYGDTYMQLPPEDKRHTHTPRVLDFGDGINVMGLS